MTMVDEKYRVSVTCVMTTYIYMESTGNYGAEFISSIDGGDFMSDIDGADFHGRT